MGNRKNLRYPLLDEVRGFAVFCMVIYHALYSLYFVFDLLWARKLLYFFMPVEPVFAALFIFICGFCTQFSRSSLKRGLLLAGAAAVITGGTYLLTFFGINEVITFGILFLLASGTLVYAVFKKWFDKCNPLWGLVISTVLFCSTYLIPKGFIGYGPFYTALPEGLTGMEGLAFLGLPTPTFSSSDYFPLMPWIFIFFFGVFVSKVFKNRPLPPFLEKSTLPPLAFLGRNALWVYLLHQPIIFGITYLLQMLFA